MVRSWGRARLALATVALLIILAPTVSGQNADEGEPGPSRVLVAPVARAADASPKEGGAVRQAVDLLVVEALRADRRLSVGLVSDLDVDTLKSLGTDPNSLPENEALSAQGARGVLRDDGSVRILILPTILWKAGGGSGGTLHLNLEWNDLVTGKTGRVSESATSPAGLVDAAGRAAEAARRAWSAEWKPGPPSPGSAQGGPAALSSITSKSPEALAAWSRSITSFNHGDPPGADAALEQALKLDEGFDRARVDLAWLKLAQGRMKEASDLAAAAQKGKKLSAYARSIASVIEAAGRPDAAAALDSLGTKLSKEAPSFPWGSFASGYARNLKGDHDPAVALLDPLLIERPSDPLVLHQSGIASLGSADPEQAVAQLGRAVELWPAHHRMVIDLAEAQLRNRDIEGARRTLQAMRERFRPEDRPIWGGDWSIEDPPPAVRAAQVDLLAGAVSKSIAAMEKDLALLDAAKAPDATRVSLLYSLHEMQAFLAFGDVELVKQKWLNAARGSMRRLQELIPEPEKQRKPWVLLRLEALVRVREGRVPEAREILAKIASASNLSGYDPGVEAEVASGIALKDAQTADHLDACRRGVAVRGAIEDLYRLALGYGISGRWKEADEQYLKLEARLDGWNNARRADALLASADVSVLVPFSYSIGGQCGYWRGDAELARARWGKFLAYFKYPDEVFKAFRVEAMDSGSKPAW